MKPTTNSHHLLFPRAEWTLRLEARKLRETPALIHRMDIDLHKELHIFCPPVPNLDHFALEKVLATFHPAGNTLVTMDRLMSSIEGSTRHLKVHPIERELAALAIEAIELQRPYILEGYVD